tara:strand:+ start:5804 stop:6415 length:612 start_codon:yes stop_codon:yes gene_type:complete
MIEIEIPKCYLLSREEFEKGTPELDILTQINEDMVTKGYCFVRILSGDYEGSIAKFTPNNLSDFKHTKTYRGSWNLKSFWYGRLSWSGKRNNPQFILSSESATVLSEYEGDTSLVKFDLKAEGKKLLETCECFDIDGCKISEGDEVVYLNLRYGSAGKLCHGTVSGFKAHARQGYISVIITRSDEDEKSECHHPSDQIWRKVK